MTSDILRRTTLVVCGLALVSSTTTAETVTGQVDVQTRGDASRGTVIVFAEPLDGPSPSGPTTARLEQKNKMFVPSVLVVPVGSTVEFPNDDPIFHNVFTLSPPQPFDLGLYRSGASKSRVFTQPGYYRIFCNIHPQMAAFLAVVPTPYATLADADGAFRLEVPRGRYRLTTLSDRAAPVSSEFTVSGATTAPALRLDETRWVGVNHKNKFGQEYPASAYEGGTHRP